MKIAPLNSWLPLTAEPLVISGPCGAESLDQLIATAKGLKALNKISLFRAGVWKPRTRPNAFEGKGEEALKWLNEIKKEFGFKITVEVANAQHTELALKYDIDVLWIGARTTVNPVSVQEIADVLKGVDVPVMVKNPIHADLQLWIGALERINNSGITKLAAIHRGFHVYGKTKYRNKPMWQLPIELRTLFPELPIICDPSHISGNKELIHSVSQKALDLGMNGLMIESHFNPAIFYWKLAENLYPNNPYLKNYYIVYYNILNNRGKDALNDGKFNDAVVNYKMATIVDPYNPEAWNNLANAFDKLNQFENAKKCREKALKLNDGSEPEKKTSKTGC